MEVDIIEAKNPLSNSKSIPTTINTYGAIILPYYGALEEDVANLTTSENILVVTTAAIPYEGTANNLYSALPTANQQRKKILDYMMAKNANIIVINDYNREESKTFVSEYAPSVTIIELKRNGSVSEEQLVSNFKKKTSSILWLSTVKETACL